MYELYGRHADGKACQQPYALQVRHQRCYGAERSQPNQSCSRGALPCPHILQMNKHTQTSLDAWSSQPQTDPLRQQLQMFWLEMSVSTEWPQVFPDSPQRQHTPCALWEGTCRAPQILEFDSGCVHGRPPWQRANPQEQRMTWERQRQQHELLYEQPCARRLLVLHDKGCLSKFLQACIGYMAGVERTLKNSA